MRPNREIQERKRVGIWLRVSTEDQARGESPEHHEKRARAYADSKDWEVVEVYHLEGVSGKSVRQHPEAQRMLEHVRAGQIQGLIFSKIARLARNTRELLDFADDFEAHGADLISLQESIDTSTPAGRLFYTVIAALAEWERSEIATRVAASIPIRARLGKSTGGAAPYGYRWVDNKLAVDDTEAPVRRLMFDLFLKHRKKLTVATALNKAGHRTRNGSKFTATTIERLIVDPIAKGIRRANYTKANDKNGYSIKKPSEWVYVEAPAIVTEELWDACNEMLRSQKNPRYRPAKKIAHLFSGFLHCICEGKMYVKSGGRSYTCLNCGNRVAEDDLEAVFVEQLKNFVYSPDRLRQFVEAADDRIAENARLLQSLETEQAQVAAEMNKVYKLYVADQISGELFASRNRPLEERHRQLQDEIPRLAGETDALRTRLLSSETALTDAKGLFATWPDRSFDERRAIIEGIVKQITASSDQINIEFLHFSSQPHPHSKSADNTSHILTDSSPR